MSFKAFVLTLLLFQGSAIAQKLRQPVFFQLADPQFGMIANNNTSQPEIDNLTSVLLLANKLHPAFVVICGDLTNNSLTKEELTLRTDQIAQFKETLKTLQDVPLYLVPGNHDVGNEPTAKNLASYRHDFGPDYYKFDSGPLIGIVLDSMLMSAKAPQDESRLQFSWLEKTLKDESARKGKQIAVFQHIPFFLHTASEPDEYWNIPQAQRAAYLRLLQKYGVKYIFSGHLHYPAYSRDGDLHLVTSGAVGKPLDHSVSGFDLVQIALHGEWKYKYFPLTAMPDHLAPPW